MEEGELLPEKDPKLQKTTRERERSSSVKDRGAEHSAEVCHLTWNPKLELDGVALP